MTTRRLPVGLFFALFTISGFAGLIYQSIWSHYLKLFLGHAAYAQTLVLAIFMGGMAIGSWLAARFTARIRNLLLGYAIAELGIGLLAIVFHPLFLSATRWAFDTVLPALGGHGTDLFKWTLASLLILPASILLGTTFPLMSGGIIRRYPDVSGRALAMLYFTNSFGAAVGVLASGFYLIDHFGLPGTVLTAGIMNILLALGVWTIVRRSTVGVSLPEAGAGAGAAAAPGLARAALILAFGTGAASFIYEVTWIRMLTLGLGASTHSFEVMLAAFILGMSLGAFWLRDRIGRIRDVTGWLAGLLALKAIFAVYAIWVYGDVLQFMGWMMHAVARTDGGYVLNTIAGLGASMVVMFPAAFCAGMALPLATYALTSRGFGESSIGKVYAANTAGCIVGAIFTTHVGMEMMGVKGLTGAGALIDLAVGVLIYFAGRQAVGSARFGLGVAAAGLAAVVAFYAAPLDQLRMSSGVYRYGDFLDPRDNKVIFYRDGKTATISVIDTGPLPNIGAGPLRYIATNGKSDASVARDPSSPASPDEATMVLAAMLPLAMKPQAETIANIGFGSGLTTHSLLASPKVRRVDTIEIERMMIEGARLFQPHNARAYSDPRSHFHIEDAKTFFASTGLRYDVITSEPSNPWVSGVSTLFSEEFYHQVKRYLKDDGLFVQWIQTYEIDLGLLSTVFNALDKQFGDYAVYAVGSADLLIVATPARKLPPMRDDIFGFPDAKSDLARLGFERLDDLRAERIGDRAALQPLFTYTGYPANSDYFPILDQQAPRARFREQNLHALLGLRTGLPPVLPLSGSDVRTPVSRLQQAGLNRPTHIDRALMGAEAIGVALTGAADRTATLPEPVRAAALVVHGFMNDCRASPGAWVDAMTQVGAVALPYLAREDVDELLAKVRGSRCFASLDELDRRRIELLEAINARDAGAIRERATYLLEHSDGRLQGERAYYLISALAAGVATGKIAESVALRERYLPRLRPADHENLQLKLVLSQLGASRGR